MTSYCSLRFLQDLCDKLHISPSNNSIFMHLQIFLFQDPQHTSGDSSVCFQRYPADPESCRCIKGDDNNLKHVKSIQQNKYKIDDNSPNHLIDIGFRKSYDVEEKYIYNFVVLKYEKMIALRGRIIANVRRRFGCCKL